MFTFIRSQFGKLRDAVTKKLNAVINRVRAIDYSIVATFLRSMRAHLAAASVVVATVATAMCVSIGAGVVVVVMTVATALGTFLHGLVLSIYWSAVESKMQAAKTARALAERVRFYLTVLELAGPRCMWAEVAQDIRCHVAGIVDDVSNRIRVVTDSKQVRTVTDAVAAKVAPICDAVVARARFYYTNRRRLFRRNEPVTLEGHIKGSSGESVFNIENQSGDGISPAAFMLIVSTIAAHRSSIRPTPAVVNDFS